jgi:hypothetical protein
MCGAGAPCRHLLSRNRRKPFASGNMGKVVENTQFSQSDLQLNLGQGSTYCRRVVSLLGSFRLLEILLLTLSLHHIKYAKRHMFGILNVDEIKN